MRIALVLPPAKTSHEIDTLRAVPGAEVQVVADPVFHPDATHPLRSFAVPWLGSPRRWTAALAWLRGMGDVALGDLDAVVSLELFSVATGQAAGLAGRLQVPHLVYVAEILDDNPLYRLPPWRGAHPRSRAPFNRGGRAPCRGPRRRSSPDRGGLTRCRHRRVPSSAISIDRAGRDHGR